MFPFLFTKNKLKLEMLDFSHYSISIIAELTTEQQNNFIHRIFDKIFEFSMKI